MSTINDVAKLAGVSVATVSRVINNSSRVSPRTRMAVEGAIKQLDFVANRNAQGLGLNATDMIGLVVPDITNPYFSELTEAIEMEANFRGYDILLCTTGGYEYKEYQYIKRLRERRVDGIIICSGVTIDKDEPFIPVSNHVPKIVYVDRSPTNSKADLITCDNQRGAYLAVTHLVSLGHSRIAIINGPSHLPSASDRYSGYRKALLDASIQFDESLISTGDYELEGGYREALRLVNLATPPTAIFAANDMMGIGVLMALKDRGIIVPRDIAVVGFDDIKLSRFTSPTMTTVAQPKHEIGRLAAERLIQKIQAIELSNRSIILEPRLVIRQSTVLRSMDSTIDGEEGA